MKTCVRKTHLKIPDDFFSKLRELKIKPMPDVIVVKVATQVLVHYKDSKALVAYRVSTAKSGTGQREGSHQTPLGLHRVAQKIGDHAEAHAIFRSREDTGEIWDPHAKENKNQNEDLILTRILWLEGLEEGFNRGNDKVDQNIDSHQRYIYIHGTNHEEDLGKAASHGCIRMGTHAIIELFDAVPEGTLVWITP